MKFTNRLEEGREMVVTISSLKTGKSRTILGTLEEIMSRLDELRKNEGDQTWGIDTIEEPS